MEKTEKAPDIISPQTFIQLVTCLKADRYMVKNGIAEAADDVKRLEKTLREQAKLLGGKGAIEDFLKKNDPVHARPSQIKDFDWSFLDE